MTFPFPILSPKSTPVSANQIIAFALFMIIREGTIRITYHTTTMSDLPQPPGDLQDRHDDEMQDDDIDMGEDSEEDEEMNAPPPEEDAAVARRRAIQDIMRDRSLSEQDKRMRIQNLMSGGRVQVAPPPAPVLPAPEAHAACVHYERNCNIVAPCCGRVFGCRICHDELSPPNHPPMNRFLVQEVVCKNCNTRQRAS